MPGGHTLSGPSAYIVQTFASCAADDADVDVDADAASLLMPLPRLLMLLMGLAGA